jgi:hypothetical protein
MFYVCLAYLLFIAAKWQIVFGTRKLQIPLMEFCLHGDTWQIILQHRGVYSDHLHFVVDEETQIPNL